LLDDVITVWSGISLGMLSEQHSKTSSSDSVAATREPSPLEPVMREERDIAVSRENRLPSFCPLLNSAHIPNGTVKQLTGILVGSIEIFVKGFLLGGAVG